MSIDRLPITVVAAAVAAVLLPSCVSTKNVPLSANDRAAMRGKTVVASKRALPSFAVLKPEAMAAASLGGAIGGAIAGGIAESQGKQQLLIHKIPPPEDTISSQVMKSLVARTGARPLPSPSSTVANEKPAAIAAQYQPADYVLDVRTTGWMGVYYPMTLTKYSIIHGSKMRLIEAKSGRVIAEGFHSYQGKDKKNAPNYVGIFSNGAAFLRAETKKSTDGAVSVFSAQL